MLLTCPHCAGPLELTVPQGRSPAEPAQRPHQRLRVQLQEYLHRVGSTEVTPAAQHVYQVSEPTTAQLQRVRRGLDALVRDGQAAKVTRNIGGWNGGRVTIWRESRTAQVAG